MAIDFPVNGATVINCGSSASLDDVFATGGTWAGWYMLDAQSTGGAGVMLLVSKTDGVFSGGWYIRVHSGIMMQCTLGNQPYWQCAVPSTGVWHHFAMTYNGNSSANNPVFYVDGGVVGSTELFNPVGTWATDAAYSLAHGNLGSSGNNTYNWDGRAEDVRFYKRILDAQEIAALAAGYRGPLGGEVLWLSMEGPSAALSTGVANVFDMSDNGNHGIPQGGLSYIESNAPRMSGWIP